MYFYNTIVPKIPFSTFSSILFILSDNWMDWSRSCSCSWLIYWSFCWSSFCKSSINSNAWSNVLSGFCLMMNCNIFITRTSAIDDFKCNDVVDWHIQWKRNYKILCFRRKSILLDFTIFTVKVIYSITSIHLSKLLLLNNSMLIFPSAWLWGSSIIDKSNKFHSNFEYLSLLD